MAEWRERLETASYKGVEFFIESSERGVGRRVPSFEYPKRDVPSTDDLGRKQRTFSFSAYVLGEEYFEKRDQLIDALESEGAGELVHPYYGVQNVRCTECSIAETKDEGGMARFSLSFIEAGTVAFPSASADKLSQLTTASDGLIEESRGAFSTIFSVAGAPGYVVESATEIVEDTVDFIEDNGNLVNKASITASELAYSLINLRANVNDLILAPEKLAQRFTDSIELLSGVWEDTKTAAKKLTGMAERLPGDTITLPDNPTTTREREKDNNEAVGTLRRRACIANAAKKAADSDWQSYTDAILNRRRLLDAIDAELLTTTSDAVYEKLIELRALLVDLVPSPDRDLPDLKTVQFKQTLPSLVIAYKVYGNIDQEQDIIDRNAIKNPCFIPGGTDLEVIDL